MTEMYYPLINKNKNHFYCGAQYIFSLEFWSWEIGIIDFMKQNYTGFRVLKSLNSPFHKFIVVALNIKHTTNIYIYIFLCVLPCFPVQNV